MNHHHCVSINPPTCIMSRRPPLPPPLHHLSTRGRRRHGDRKQVRARRGQSMRRAAACPLACPGCWPRGRACTCTHSTYSSSRCVESPLLIARPVGLCPSVHLSKTRLSCHGELFDRFTEPHRRVCCAVTVARRCYYTVIRRS